MSDEYEGGPDGPVGDNDDGYGLPASAFDDEEENTCGCWYCERARAAALRDA
jgi:hypothetical protein